MKKILSLIVLALLPVLIFSQNKFKTNSISIFKDGTVFLDKSTTLDASGGKVELTELPYTNGEQYVLFGTLLMQAENNSITQAKVSEKEIEKEDTINELNFLFGKNAGKRIKIVENNGVVIEGILRMPTSNRLVIQKDNEWFSVSVDEIRSFEFLDGMKTTYTYSSKQKSLELEFFKSAKNQPFRLMYLQKGIIWAPNYFFQLLGDNKAKLNLKANVMNDLEDLEDVEMNFVVGVPAFRYENVAEPLTSKYNFNVFLASLNRVSSNPESLYGNNLNYATTFDPETYEEQIQVVTTPKVDVTQNEDLFFYKKKNITLEKGARALYDIFEAELEYEDIYTVKLQPNQPTYNSYGNNSNQDVGKNIVWHALKFENNTGYPLTAGAVFFLNKTADGSNMPLSQNQIKYAPQSGEVMVKMAIASDILVLDADKEINPRQKGKRQITVEGTIDVTNYRSETTQLKIEKVITGNPLESDTLWEQKGITTQLNNKNPKFKVNWEFELKAKETKKITYTYEVNLR
ncbi:MAG: hypothetical protein AAF573_10835 [Bacteroidota bacterium]